jgi:hypothetical protein
MPAFAAAYTAYTHKREWLTMRLRLLPQTLVTCYPRH